MLNTKNTFVCFNYLTENVSLDFWLATVSNTLLSRYWFEYILFWPKVSERSRRTRITLHVINQTVLFEFVHLKCIIKQVCSWWYAQNHSDHNEQSTNTNRVRNLWSSQSHDSFIFIADWFHSLIFGWPNHWIPPNIDSYIMSIAIITNSPFLNHPWKINSSRQHGSMATFLLPDDHILNWHICYHCCSVQNFYVVQLNPLKVRHGWIKPETCKTAW